MPKLLIMYNLKDDLKEEDFVKWVHEFKGPFISGLSAVKSRPLQRSRVQSNQKVVPPGLSNPHIIWLE